MSIVRWALYTNKNHWGASCFNVSNMLSVHKQRCFLAGFQSTACCSPHNTSQMESKISSNLISNSVCESLCGGFMDWFKDTFTGSLGDQIFGFPVDIHFKQYLEFLADHNSWQKHRHGLPDNRIFHRIRGKLLPGEHDLGCSTAYKYSR